MYDYNIKTMKSYIQQLLRENLNNRLHEVPATRREFKKLHQLVEKKIRVGDNITKKLNRVDTPLAKNVLRFLTSDDIKDDANVDYVDYDKKNEKLFSVGYTDQRGGAKERLMKFNKMLSYLGGKLENIKGYEVEELVNHLKSADLDELKLVRGKKILWAYHCDNYDEDSTMGSCMRYDYAQKYLEMYVVNPNQVACLVLVNPENGKVRGRALVWTCEDGTKYMDRVYTTNTKYRVEFNTFAEENNISTNSPQDDVILDHGGEFDYYPYMDTFEWYTPEDDRLSADDGELRLQDTQGGENSGVYSDWHEENIPEDEAVYIEHMNSYMYGHECEYSNVEDEWVYPEHDDVYLINVGEYEGNFALEENIVILYNDDITHTDEAYLIDKGDYSGEFAHEDDMVRDWEDNDILRDDAEEITAGIHIGEMVFKEEAILVYEADGVFAKVFTSDDDMSEFEESDEYRISIGVE
jgi:hypothetical protein